MQHARLQEGCRFPPGKILHDLLQDECVACKRATKGISWSLLHVEKNEEEMQQARLREGCRFPPGKILHGLLQDECVACKRATKGISWRWRWRSPW